MNKLVDWRKYIPKEDGELDFSTGGGNVQTIRIKGTNTTSNLIFDEDIPFEFYTGLTQFDIDGKCREILSKLPGIEIVTGVSRYRVVVAVAPLFNHDVVLKAATNALIDYAIPKETKQEEIDLTDEEKIQLEGVRIGLGENESRLPENHFFAYEKNSDGMSVFSIGGTGGSEKFKNELRKFINRYLYENNGGIIKASS